VLVTFDQSRSPAASSQAPDQLLVALRGELTAELHATEVALDDLRRQRADRFDDDEHDPEGLPLSGEFSRLDGLRRATRLRITEVDAALANADAGRYGICLGCGLPIPPGRLEVRPTATLCVACASR
jgi:RNA polymerase-binding transcription factor DksA